jgi:hypothetical protein
MTSRTIKLVALAVFALIVGLTVHAWLVAQDDQQRLQSTVAAQKQVIDDANSRQRSRDAALNNTVAEIEKLKNTMQSSQQLVDQLQKYLALPQPVLLVNRGLSPSAAPGKRPSAVTRQPTPSTDPAGIGSAKGNRPPDSRYQTAAPSGQRNIALGPQQQSSLAQDPSQPPSNSPSHLQSGTSPTSPQSGQILFSPTAQSLLHSISGKPCSGSPDCAAEIPASDLKPLYNYVQDCRACDAQLTVAEQNASDDAAKIAALTRERAAAITASKGGSFLRRLRRDILWLSVGAALGYAAHR